MAFYVATHASIFYCGPRAARLTNTRDGGIARRFTLASIAIAVSLGVLTVPSSWAAEPPFTFAEALKLAASDSRQLVAQDAAVTAASEMASSAGERPDPVLKLGVDNLPVTGPDPMPGFPCDWAMLRGFSWAPRCAAELPSWTVKAKWPEV